jgi:hypothetical protein
MNEIVKRLSSESPTFFKRITKIGLTIGAIGTAIVTMPTAIIVLPAELTTIGGYMIAIGTVAAAIAKTTVSNPSVLTESTNQNSKEGPVQK